MKDFGYKARAKQQAAPVYLIGWVSFESETAARKRCPADTELEFVEVDANGSATVVQVSHTPRQPGQQPYKRKES